MQEALQKERREHELTKKALELSRRTTQQMHAVWNDIMTNLIVILNYKPVNEVEPQPDTGADEDEQLQEELRQERETQELEAPE